MLLIQTKIGPSTIHGIGLFADEFIKKGTIIWKFNPAFDMRFDESQLESLSESARKQFFNYVYLNPRMNKYVLCFDDCRFINHSDDPNRLEVPSGGPEEGLDIAARDIQKGEELTCDYGSFDVLFKEKMQM
jgi:SET domain-containing protein